jgi:Ca-activated chloride channel family protein
MKSSARYVYLLLVAIAISSSSASAQTRQDKTLSPYFFVQGDPKVDHLPLKDTRVQINVSGVIADVKVLQTYRNEGSRPINASYVFPASTRAAVYSMQMRIGDQVIVARIKERENAKQEFDQAKQEGKSASLLEQNRPNVFSMSLANVMPGDQIDVELRYTELLVPTDGIYEMVFPPLLGLDIRPSRSPRRLRKTAGSRIRIFIRATSRAIRLASQPGSRPVFRSGT